MNGVRDRLGLLCDQLTRHRAMTTEIAAAGAGPQLEELLDLLSAAPDTSAARLGELLDAIEEACARHGLAPLDVRGPVDGRPGNGRLPPGFALTTDGAAASGAGTVDAWVCPWGRCGRVVFPEEEAGPPACAAGDEPLHAFPPR
ncbi:hypothetical protein [Streptomyces calvus]|uniref:Uncharacterized protein n=1 Tax=Streptomyces calvus TaxID=67282 RepID=A0AA40S8S5_9ACTN|nr:hypothetical protein [Streptomyces calvus]MBA8941858.1 hypothetical protein [Streptomyces calvus]GGP61312.1 hypothetical protein GCM10010247_37330 [Streptomyces calvus]